MNYEEFISALIRSVSAYFSSDTDFRLQKIYKNNGVVLDALLILPPGRRLSPCFYLKDYFDLYRKGAGFGAIAEELVFLYKQEAPGYIRQEEEESGQAAFDFDAVCGKIIFRIIHCKRNEQALKQIPFLPFLDLAVTFHCLIGMTESNLATRCIQNDDLDKWGLDKQQLVHFARKNTPSFFHPVIRPVNDMLLEQGEDAKVFHQDVLYVLTNQIGINGASVLLYPEVLKGFSDSIRSDLFILPSSIHEVLLLPYHNSIDKERLLDIVADINRTQVPAEDILSGHVYYFQRSTGRISIC